MARLRLRMSREGEMSSQSSLKICFKLIVGFPFASARSFVFIPNTELINDNGRKIIVTIVNNMMDLPWVTLSSARFSAYLASMILACCCLRLRRSLSCFELVFN